MKISILLITTLFTSFGGAAHADCYDDAGAFHSVNPWILRAITYDESRGNAKATRRNSNGTEDVGATQTNSVHFESLRQYGIRRDDLLDACTSVYVGAWLYAKKVRKYGNTWTAVGAYHSETPSLRDAYAIRIKHWIDLWSREGRLR